MASRRQLSERYYGKKYSDLNSRQKQQVDRDLPSSSSPSRRRQSRDEPAGNISLPDGSTAYVPPPPAEQSLEVQTPTTSPNIDVPSSSSRGGGGSPSRSTPDQFVVGVEDPSLQQSREVKESREVEQPFSSANNNFSVAPATEFVASRSDPGVITSRQGGARRANIEYDLPGARPLPAEQVSSVERTPGKQFAALLPGQDRRRRGLQFINRVDDLAATSYQNATRSFTQGDPIQGTIGIGNTAVAGLVNIGSGTAFLVDSLASTQYALYTDPEARQAALGALTVFATDRPIRRTRQGLLSVGSSLGEAYLAAPPAFLADVFAPSVGGRLVSGIRDTTVRVVGRKIPAERIFDPDALAGTTRFPTANNLDELEQSFRKSNFEVITASPTPLRGREAAKVGRAAKGTEGAGISVTPVGRGSPEFLGLRNEGFAPYDDFTVSLNPFRSSRGRPTATTFQGEGIVRTPESVTRQPGFEAENVFMREQVAGTGKLVIPKRILIGQGEVRPQVFQPTPDSRFRLEKGTSEIEAKVPLGQRFSPRREGNVLQRLAGFSEFVEVGGRPVPIRPFDLSIDRQLDDAFTTGSRASRRASSVQDILSRSSSSAKRSLDLSPTRLTPSSAVISSSSSPSSSSIFSSTTPSTSASSSRASSSSSSSPSTSISSISSNISPSSTTSFTSVSSPLSSTSSSSSRASSSSSSSPSTSISSVSSSRSSSQSSSPRSSRSRIRIPLESSESQSRSSRSQYQFSIGRKGTKNRQQFTASSLAKGVKKAKGLVGSTLSASFSVKKNGQDLTVNEYSRVKKTLGKQYYRSRVKRNSFVEKKKYRLDTKSETRAIQRARTVKSITGKGFFDKALKGVQQGIPLRKMRRRLF